MKKIEINGHWRLDEDRTGKREEWLYSSMQDAKQARKGYRSHKPSSACALKFCSFVD